jgi:3-oxoacyl-[acyl-carrier protein] reductase
LNLDLGGKVAVVTAASRGLGRACALMLGQEGMRVALGVRDPTAGSVQELVGLIQESGGEAVPVPLDLTAPETIDALVSSVVERWGSIHALVANTPGPLAGPFESITTDMWREALDVHVLAVVRLTQRVLPVMKSAGGGRIVYITTVGVKTAQPNMVLSNATRLAVVGLAKTLSLEVAKDEIMVNVVAPGPIETDRMTELIADTASRNGIDVAEAERIWLDEVPLGRAGRPEDLASMVALLLSDRCSFVTGVAIPIDGGKARGY